MLCFDSCLIALICHCLFKASMPLQAEDNSLGVICVLTAPTDLSWLEPKSTEPLQPVTGPGRGWGMLVSQLTHPF